MQFRAEKSKMLRGLRHRAATITKIGQETRNTMVYKKSLNFFPSKVLFRFSKLYLYFQKRNYFRNQNNFVFGNKNKILKIEKALLKEKKLFFVYHRITRLLADFGDRSCPMS